MFRIDTLLMVAVVVAISYGTFMGLEEFVPREVDSRTAEQEDMRDADKPEYRMAAISATAEEVGAAAGRAAAREVAAEAAAEAATNAAANTLNQLLAAANAEPAAAETASE